MNSYRDRLIEYLVRVFPNRHKISITEPTLLGSGWESDIIGFHAAWQDESQPGELAMALRLYNGTGASEKASHECHSLISLRAASYPVPKVYDVNVESTIFGKPFIIMEMIDGKTMWALLEQANPEQASKLLDQFNDLVFNLHQLDWRLFWADDDQPLENNPYWFIDGWLKMAGRAVVSSGVKDFDPVLRWLENRRNLLEWSKPSAVHGDFHPNNVLIKPDGSAVVIDWTNFQIADARYDLAWTLLLARVYAGENVRNMILERYARSSGDSIDHLDIFEVIACIRRLYDILSSLSNGADRMGMRSEVAAIMQQQLWASQIVYELLLGHTGIRIPAVEKMLG